MVSSRAPTEAVLADLEFAWRVCKHVKSNAIVLAARTESGDLATVGVGAGQMSRVDSATIAGVKAQRMAEVLGQFSFARSAAHAGVFKGATKTGKLMAFKVGNGYIGIGLNDFLADINLLEPFLVDGHGRFAFAPQTIGNNQRGVHHRIRKSVANGGGYVVGRIAAGTDIKGVGIG